jgi:hypothetical protein
MTPSRHRAAHAMQQDLTRRQFLNRLAALGAGGLIARRSAATETPSLPSIRLGRLNISRLILDADPFDGQGHASYLVCKAMKQFYTDQQIARTLDEAAALGVTAVVGTARDVWPEFYPRYLQQGGKLKTWIAQAEGKSGGIAGSAAGLPRKGAHAVFIHPRITDRVYRAGRWDTFETWFRSMRETGALTGIATGIPAALAVYAKRTPADFYLLTFEGRADDYPEDWEPGLEAVRQIEQPVILHKLLDPLGHNAEEILRFVLDRVNPKDPICLGVFPKENPRQLQHYRNLLAA